MFDMNVDVSWREAKIPKKSGKLRTLQIPNDALKKEQNKILAFLYSFKELNPSVFAHGFIPYRNTITGVKRHDPNADVIICCDVKDFFDSMNPQLIERRMLSAGVPASIVEEILKLCTYRGGFPQGAPTSPYLTNIGMFEADLMIATYAKNNGLTYSRYADDMAFAIDPNAFPELNPEKRRYGKFVLGLDKLLREKTGLRLNMEKTHVIRKHKRVPRRVTGIVIRKDGQGYNIPKRTRMQLRAGFHNLYKRVCVEGRKPTTGDYTRWRELYGLYNYDKYVRAASAEGFNFPDPKVRPAEIEALMAIFMKKGA